MLVSSLQKLRSSFLIWVLCDLLWRVGALYQGLCLLCTCRASGKNHTWCICRRRYTWPWYELSFAFQLLLFLWANWEFEKVQSLGKYASTSCNWWSTWASLQRPCVIEMALWREETYLGPGRAFFVLRLYWLHQYGIFAQLLAFPVKSGWTHKRQIDRSHWTKIKQKDGVS